MSDIMFKVTFFMRVVHTEWEESVEVSTYNDFMAIHLATVQKMASWKLAELTADYVYYVACERI